MPIEDIVDVTITAETARVSRAGFGIPLIAAYHTHWTDRVRTYSASSALSAMTGEGFSTSESAYLAMQAILSANPRPRQVKIGRRSEGAWTQIVRLTPLSAVNNGVYSVLIDGQLATFTADGSATIAEICTGLAAAINALAAPDPAVTASGVSGTHVDCTADATLILHNFTDPTSNLSVTDVTAEQNIATDLDLIRDEDQDWYGLVLDSSSSVEIADAAAWAETQDVLFIPHSADSDMLTSSTTDLGSDLEALGYKNTGLVYHPEINSFAGAAWLGAVLPLDPGSETWAFKTLAGIAVYDLTPTEQGHLDAKNVNHYTTVGGVNITRHGYSSGGTFFDQTRFIAWLKARITESVFALIVSRPKLPYTDASVDLIKSVIYARLLDAVAIGGLTATPEPTVEAPLVADVDPVDRANRLLPDVSFSGQLGGAIHKVIIQGNLSI